MARRKALTLPFINGAVIIQLDESKKIVKKLGGDRYNKT